MTQSRNLTSSKKLISVECKAIIGECHMFMVSRETWETCWDRRPRHIAIESLTQWSRTFELVDIQYEPLLSEALDALQWI